jgi:hypothetical protein
MLALITVILPFILPCYPAFRTIVTLPLPQQLPCLGPKLPCLYHYYRYLQAALAQVYPVFSIIVHLPWPNVTLPLTPLLPCLQHTGYPAWA